jgi:hypothetical protein
MGAASLALFQEADAAYRIGVLVGQITALLMLLVGSLKCLSMLRRPTVNRKCLLALGVVLAGWGIGTAGAIFGDRLPAVSFLVLPSRLLSLASYAVGMSLGIAGLIDLRSRSAAIPLQGKAQAICAIVIGGVLGLALVGAFVAGAVGGFVRGADPSRASHERGGGKLSFPDIHCAFQLPGKPWVQVDAKKLNPLASVALTDPKRRMFFILIGERLETGAEVGDALLAEVAKANLKGAASAATLGPDEPLSLGPVPGVAFDADATVSGLDLSYRYWVHAGKGTAWQLILWGARKDRAAVKSDALTLFPNFSVTAP